MQLRPLQFACLSALLAGCNANTSITDAVIITSDPTSAAVISNPPAGTTVSLGVGDTARLDPGTTVRRGRVVAWTSSNTPAVQVNAQGVAVAVASGAATITAAGTGFVQRWTIKVGKAVANITATPDSVTLAPGSTQQLVILLAAADGTVITNRKVTFTAAGAAATVNATGLVTAKVVGSTIITVAAGSLVRSVRAIVAVPAAPPTPPPPTPTPPAAGELGLNASLGSRSLFPADNAWNQPIDTAAVDPNSSAIIANIGATKSFHPDFGANYDGGPFGIPYYVVSGTQAGVNVSFDYDDESDHGLYPVPPNAPIEGGASSTGDRHVLIVDRDHWKLYELYAAYPQANGTWHAGSGAIFDLASNALRPAGWTSADAAGLPMLPGLVRYDEVSAGVIAHAIRFTVARTRKAYIPPARHWASSDTSSLRPPMGMRVRLKASVNIASYPASAQVILRALKKYGMIVADNGSDWYASGTADARWNDDQLNTLKALKGQDFEVVRMSGVVRP